MDVFVRSMMATLSLIPALSERASIEFTPSDIDCFGFRELRFSFFRKSADSAIVADKTNVCLFFLWMLGMVTESCVFPECTEELFFKGSMSIIDCNSWKWPLSIIRSASSSTKKDNECNCKSKEQEANNKGQALQLAFYLLNAKNKLKLLHLGPISPYFLYFGPLTRV